MVETGDAVWVGEQRKLAEEQENKARREAAVREYEQEIKRDAEQRQFQRLCEADKFAAKLGEVCVWAGKGRPYARPGEEPTLIAYMRCGVASCERKGDKRRIVLGVGA